MHNKIKFGFSLAEMMVVLLIVTVVLAAATPIITKNAMQKTSSSGSSESGLTLNALGTVDHDITLNENSITTAYFTGSTSITLPAVTKKNKPVTCILDFTTASANYPTITNSNLIWLASSTGLGQSAYCTASKVHNYLTFKSNDGGSNWEAEYKIFGGVELPFSQPALSADGGLGGSKFAVYSPNVYSPGYDAYRATDNDPATVFTSTGTSFSYIWYNPTALKVSSINITNRNSSTTPGNTYAIYSYILYGSNDNSTWITLFSSSNSNYTSLGTWSIIVPSTSQGFYKYYKLYVPTGALYPGFSQATLNATYMSN